MSDAGLDIDCKLSSSLRRFEVGYHYDEGEDADFEFEIPFGTDTDSFGSNPIIDRFRDILIEKFEKLGHKPVDSGYVRQDVDRDDYDAEEVKDSFRVSIIIPEISRDDLLELQKDVLRQVATDEGQAPHPDALLPMGTKAFLRKNGVEVVSYNDSDIESHIMRHSENALDIGSKFFYDPIKTTLIIHHGQEKLENGFRSLINTTGKIGRVEVCEIDREPVGKDALIDLSSVPAENVFELVRDAGDPKSEARIKVVLADPKDIPLTNQITFIGGPYGPTGKAGFYTAFPGDPGQPFSNTDYWKTHGFLATPAQVRYTINRMLAKADEVSSAVATPGQTARLVEAAQVQLDIFAAQKTKHEAVVHLKAPEQDFVQDKPMASPGLTNDGTVPSPKRNFLSKIFGK